MGIPLLWQAVRQAASRSSLNLENDCKQSGGWLTDAIKKMENMKKFFLLMMACGVALWGRAQQGTDVLMATLQHGDEVSMYYGKTALEEAYTGCCGQRGRGYVECGAVYFLGLHAEVFDHCGERLPVGYGERGVSDGNHVWTSVQTS